MDRGNRRAGQGRQDYQQGPNARQRNDHDSYNRSPNHQGQEQKYCDSNDSSGNYQNQERECFDYQEPMRNRGGNQVQNNYQNDNRQNRGNQQNDDDTYHSGRGLYGHGGREQGQGYNAKGQRRDERLQQGQGGRGQNSGYDSSEIQSQAYNVREHDDTTQYAQNNRSEDRNYDGRQQQGQGVRGKQPQNGKGPRGQTDRRQQDQGCHREKDKREQYPQRNRNEDQSERDQYGQGGSQQRGQVNNDRRENFQDEGEQYPQGNGNRGQSYSGRGQPGIGGREPQRLYDRGQHGDEYFEGEQVHSQKGQYAQLNRNQDKCNSEQHSSSNCGKKDRKSRWQGGQDGRGGHSHDEMEQQGNGSMGQQGGSYSSQVPNSGSMPNTALPMYNIPLRFMGYQTQPPVATIDKAMQMQQQRETVRGRWSLPFASARMQEDSNIMPPMFYQMQPQTPLLPTPPLLPPPLLPTPPPLLNFNKPLPRSSSTFSVDSVGVKGMNKPRARNNGERDQERTHQDDRFKEDQRNLNRSCSTTSINSVGSTNSKHSSANRNQRGPEKMSRPDPGNNTNKHGNMDRSSNIRNINDAGQDSFLDALNGGVDNKSNVSYRDRGVHDRVGPSGRSRGRGIQRGGRPDNRRNNMPNQGVASASMNSINRGMENRARYRGNRSGRGTPRGGTTRGVVPEMQPGNVNVKNCQTNSTTAMAHRLLRGNRPKGRMSGMSRGNRAIGRMKSQWHGFVERKNDDASSSSTKDDCDDNMSTCSDFSQASNFVEDISDAGLHDTKVEIMLEDINTVGLTTLKNRKMRYKRKLADMKKKNENKDAITKFQEQLDKVQKVYHQRVNEEQSVNNGNTKSKNTNRKNPKPNLIDEEINVEAADPPVVELNTDTKKMSRNPKAKRVSAMVAAKCHVSFNPKSKKQSKGKHIVKKPAKQSSDNETSDEFEDVLDEEIKLNPPFAENPKEPKNYKPDALDKQRKADDKQPATTNQQRGAVDKKKLAQKPIEASRGPDVNAIFKFLVKNFEGKGTPEEIVRESGLFPVDFDAIGWFRKMRSRFHLLERNGIIDVVFVFNKDVTYCMDYIRNTSCIKADCQRYHVCKDMLAGNCVRGMNCKFSHDMLDERNMRISKELGFKNIFANDEICSILRVRYPHVCPSWIENGSCNDTGCIGLHLCRRYILGNCFEGDACPMIHDIFSYHNKPIVECYCMEKWDKNLFRKAVYMIRHHAAEGDETVEPIKVDEVRGVNAVANNNDPSKSRLKRDKSREKETDPCDDLVLCDLFLVDKCRKKCKLIHGSLQLPYLWQVNLFGSWFTYQRSEDIEKAFCDNKDFSDRLYMIHNQMELQVVVTFKPSFRAFVDIIGAEHTTETTEARRLSTPSYKEGDENSASFKTQWRWYWQDDQREWHLFEPDTLQHTLEIKYLAKQRTYNYSRENYRFKYSIDFNAMVQHNIDSGKQRAINRVPVFVSLEDVMTKNIPKVLLPAPSIETPLPENWVPWDLAHPFELVKLAENSRDYHTVSDHFYKTMDIEKQKIDSVYRLQNQKLWGLFCNLEKFMEANLKRLGSDTPLNKPYLFHGTDSLDAVRGICINNFDNRVSGKNATMHGDGTYFARDAKYSHCYTKPPLRFMFMVTALIGHYTKGDKSYRRPPNKPGNDHELFDSCVDDVNNPLVYVVFDKNQYYPEFLIHYRNVNDESSENGLHSSDYTLYSGGSGNVTAANLNSAINVGSGLTSQPSYRCHSPPPTVYPVQQYVAYPGYSTPNHAGPQMSSQPSTCNPASTTQNTAGSAPSEKKKDDCCIQ